MRKLLVALTLVSLALLLPVPEARAQITDFPPAFGTSFTGGPVTTPILFPDGTAGAPSMSFATDPDTGFFLAALGNIGVSTNGTERFRFGSGGSLSNIGGLIVGTTIAGGDTHLNREAAAVWQFGVDVNGAAVDQTLAAADAITGSDISGGDLTIQSGSGMGTGTVSALIFQTPTIAAAGANAQSLATRLTVNSAGANIVGSTTTSTSFFATAGGFVAANTSGFTWNSFGKILAASDGVFTLQNNGATDFNRLQFGGTTSSFPAWKRSTTELHARLADDSAYTTVVEGTDSKVALGTGTGLATHVGIICVSTTAAPTTGTSEEILATCTLPANSLSANGKGVRIKAWGESAANANSKNVRLRFGGIGGTIISTRTFSVASRLWMLDATVLRTGASAQISFGENGDGAENATITIAQNRSSPAADTTAAIAIVVTGLTATAAADVTLTGFMVETLN